MDTTEGHTAATTGKVVVAWLRTHQEPLSSAVLALALVGIVGLSIAPVRDMVERRAREWLGTLQAPMAEDEPPKIPSLETPTPENQRLVRQLGQVRRRLKFHGEVAVFFYARYYLAITIASTAGLLAGAMLLLITRTGWQQASSYIKVTFMVAAATAAYYAAFPGMFQQAQNIADNVSLYVAYGNVENELLSYLATGQNVTGQAQAPSEFIHALDARLAELHKVPIGFDASKLPSSVDAFRGISK